MPKPYLDYLSISAINMPYSLFHGGYLALFESVFKEFSNKPVWVFVWILCSFSNYAQDTIFPSQQVTFGSKIHTNRDELSHTLKDSRNNIYLIGTTENDFTFNDIQVIKLNSDFSELWSRTYSFNTNFSYDRVTSAHIDSQDNLILVCRSAMDKVNELYFILKVDPKGNKLWEIPLFEYSRPAPINPFLFHATLDENDNLQFAYANWHYYAEKEGVVYFIEVSSEGQITKSYNAVDLFPEVSVDNQFVIEYHKGFYYMIASITDGNHRIMYYKFNDTESFSTEIEIPQTVLENLKFTPFTDASLEYRENTGLQFTAFGTSHDQLLLLNLNQDGSVNYVREPDLNKEQYVIGHFFDKNDDVGIISNQKTIGSTEDLHMVLEKFDDKGELIQSLAVPGEIGMISYVGSSFIGVYTVTNKLLKYNYDFSLVSETQLKPIKVDEFVPSCIFFNDEDSFLAGTNLSIGYEGSKYYSENDWSFKKVSNGVELDEFQFSGEGTSKADQTKSIQRQNNGNYVVAVSEKTGPDNYGLGGSRSPSLSHILTYSNDLELIEKQTDVDNAIWDEKSNNSVSFTSGSDSYEYYYNSNTSKITLTKNGNEVLWTRIWNGDLHTPSGFVIDSENSLIFRSLLYNQGLPHLNKLTMDNVRTRVAVDKNPFRIIMLDNDWVFTSNSTSIQVYSNDFELISEYPIEYDYNMANYAPFMQKNNKVMVYTTFDNVLRVFSQYGEFEKEYMFFGDLYDRNAFFEGNDLVVLSSIGSYIISEFQWQRAVVNKYVDFVTKYIGETSYGDQDGDGVSDFIDRCPKTPKGNAVNEFGCNSIEFSVDSFSVIGSSESCPSSANGSIEVSAKESHNYTAVLMNNGSEISVKSFTNNGVFNDLGAGLYSICIRTDGLREIEYCYEIKLNEVQPLFVEANVNGSSNKVTLSLKGADHYTVTFNDETFITSLEELELTLNDFENTLIVQTKSACQGVYEKTFLSSDEIIVYPNPLADGELKIVIGSTNGDPVSLSLYDVNGKHILSQNQIPIDGVLHLDMEELSPGMYFLNLNMKVNDKTYKIIKR